MRYLLRAGSDFRICNTRGDYPLTLAARYGRNDTVKLLLQSCSAVKCEEIMTSVLTGAIVAGRVDTTALLLRSGATVSRGEYKKPIYIYIYIYCIANGSQGNFQPAAAVW